MAALEESTKKGFSPECQAPQKRAGDKHIYANVTTDRNAEGVHDERAEDELAHRAAAMLPAGIIHHSEIIFLFIKPSPLYIVLHPLGTLMSLIILTAAAVWINGKWNFDIGRQNLMLIGAGLVGLRMFWQFLEWLTSVYVLTDQRVIKVCGVFKTRASEVRLDKIEHVDVKSSWREWLFGLGTIGFTVGGQELLEAAWHMVSCPGQVRQKIIDAIHRDHR